MARGTALLVLAMLFVGAFAQLPAYVSPTGTYPWGRTSLATEMTNVFGPENVGWENLALDVVPANVILDPARPFIRLEGSDSASTEMEVWFLANQAAVEAWVSAGGALYFNCAPNEDNGFDMGFGGHVLIRDLAGAVSVPAGQVGSPPFTTPDTVAQAYTGNSASHAAIGGAGTCYLQDSMTLDCVLLGMPFGRGYVMFGGLTPSFYWDPQADAGLLQQNIITFVTANALVLGGDPHVFGAHGENFFADMQPGVVYSVLRDAAVIVNCRARAIPWLTVDVPEATRTYVNEVSMQTPGHSLILRSKGRDLFVTFDGDERLVSSLVTDIGVEATVYYAEGVSISLVAIASESDLPASAAFVTEHFAWHVPFMRFVFTVRTRGHTMTFFAMDLANEWNKAVSRPDEWFFDFTTVQRPIEGAATPTGILGQLVHHRQTGRSVDDLSDVESFRIGDDLLAGDFL